MLENLVNFENSKEWREFKDYCENGFLSQLNYYGLEDVHTNFISSLLKKNNIYGLGSEPLKLFLELLYFKINEQDKHDIYKNYFDDVDFLKDIDLDIIDVCTQKVIGVYGKLDLYIEFILNKKKYLIVIENKLFSNESSVGQCKKYQDYFESKEEYSEYNKIYVYLSPYKNPELTLENEIKIPYIKITYQNLMEKLFEPCYFKNPKNSIYLYEYIRSFVDLYLWFNEPEVPRIFELKRLALDIYDNYSEELRNILNYKNEFYKENRDLIKILAISLAKEIKSDGELETSIKRIANIKNKWKGNPLNKTDFIDVFITDIIRDFNIESIDEIEQVIYLSGKKKFKIIITEDDNNPKVNEWFKVSKRIPDSFGKVYYYDSITQTELISYIEYVKSLDERFCKYIDDNLELI